VAYLAGGKTKTERFGRGVNYHLSPVQEISAQNGGEGPTIQHFNLVNPRKESILGWRLTAWVTATLSVS